MTLCQDKGNQNVAIREGVDTEAKQFQKLHAASAK